MVPIETPVACLMLVAVTKWPSGWGARLGDTRASRDDYIIAYFATMGNGSIEVR